MSPVIPARLLALAVALLVTPGPLVAQGAAPCVGWTVDTTRPSSIHGGIGAGDGRIVAARFRNGFEPAVEVHVFDPALDRYVVEQVIADPSWPTFWTAGGFVVEGDRAVARPRPIFSATPQLLVLERGPAGWAHTTVRLQGPNGLRLGNNAAIDGDRIAAITTELWQPFDLHIVERTPAGEWQVAQRLELTGIRGGYTPKYPGYVALDGDLAAVSMNQMSPAPGAVAVCERDPATGVWSQAALLRMPDLDFRPAGLDLEGQRLAIHGDDWGPAMRAATWILDRQPGGQWRLTQEILEDGNAGGALLEGGRLVTSAGGTVTVHEQTSVTTYAPVARYVGLGDVVALEADRVVGRQGRRARAAPFPIQAPPLGGPPELTVCQDLGAAYCHEQGAAAPRVRFYYARHFNGTTLVSRAQLAVEGAPPGALAYPLVALEPGRRTLAGGTLCLDPQGVAVPSFPALVPASGSAAIDFASPQFVGPGNLGEAVHLQVLTIGAGPPRLSNAVHFVL